MLNIDLYCYRKTIVSTNIFDVKKIKFDFLVIIFNDK